MSRLRNRNIRTKIHAVARWGQQLAGSQTNGKLLEHDGTTTTADSGIGEAVPLSHPKLNNPRGRKWNSDVGLEANAERRITGPTNDAGNSSDDESHHSFSSVDTLRVLEEIRNLEDSVMSMSAESYNSWNEEYENDNTQLVKVEFERMERVLQRKEPIPSHYDKDEYKLWIKTFPLLSLVTRSRLPDASPPNSSAFHRFDTQNANVPSPKFCDTTTPTPHAADVVIDKLETFHAFPSDNQPTTTHSDKYLAINHTINPRTVSISADHSFLQLAPLNLARRHSLKPTASQTPSGRGAPTRGSGSSWWTGAHDVHNRFSTFCTSAQAEKRSPQRPHPPERRRKSSRTESLKSSSEFIVLPPIDGKELRSSSAATIANLGKASVLTLGRLRHPPVCPLYENNEHCDDSDSLVSYRHRKRKY